LLKENGGKGALFTVFSTEFIDPSGGIHYTLLAGVKRMTGRTYFDKQVLRQYGTGYKSIATATSDCYLFICWMNFWFHIAST